MKILILANNINWKSWDKKISLLQEWFKPVIDIQAIVRCTSFINIPTEKYTDTEGKQYDGILQTWYDTNISLPAKAEGFDVVVLSQSFREWVSFPAMAYTNPNNTGIYEIAVGADEFDPYDFQGRKYLTDRWTESVRHELCHVLYAMQSKTDNTHLYYATGQIDKILSELTKVKTETLEVVTLYRQVDTGKSTRGTLIYKNFVCSTLELPYKNNSANVSCIPKGTYLCKYTMSTLLKKKTYELISVPKRTGIRVHSANYVLELKGCISLGTHYQDLDHDGEWDVVNSNVIIKKFESLLNKKDFKLIIK